MNIKDIIPMSLRYKIMGMRNRGVYSGYPDECQCIYIHIPKTAGTSIVKSLFNATARHVRYVEYQAADTKKFERYFKFTFVRNPWDRVVSTYFFLKKGGLNELDKNWSDQNMVSYNSFEDFVVNWLTEENIWSWVHFYPQYYFFYDDDGNNMMDYVARFENIEEEFRFIRERLGKTCELSKVNVGSNSHYTDYYNERTKKIVEDVYRKDIVLFNYRYGD
jgi:hypothetical protein